ncbi:MAG: PspC domain-containing protein [Bacillota bacterium]|jgi:phage shock protein PspC (stress-responsive transcriptional regulator)|nr:PspC domain-containing protein [Bacillota bacterium]HHT90444.1 PspC domain-containing protein [Bacillota bacterium]
MAKRIYRSREKKIGGVCGGFAEYFNIDPTIIRLGWAILALVYGTGLLAYLICWIVIPDDPLYR